MTTDYHLDLFIEIPVFELEGAPHVFHDPELRQMASIATVMGSKGALTYLTATVANNMLAQITTSGLWLGLLSTAGNPGTEIPYNSATGYTQATRQAIAWAGAASGVVVSNTTQTFTMGGTWTPAPIPYFGLFGASTAGTYYGGGGTGSLTGNIPAGANVTFTSSVTLTVSG